MIVTKLSNAYVIVLVCIKHIYKNVRVNVNVNAVIDKHDLLSDYMLPSSLP